MYMLKSVIVYNNKNNAISFMQNARYPLYRRLGGPPGQVWTAEENLAPLPHRDSISGASSP
jgi:hypothetical protein